MHWLLFSLWDKIPNRSNLRTEGAVLTHSLRTQPIMVAKTEVVSATLVEAAVGHSSGSH